LIENTITAISKDSRFEKLKQDEVKDIKIRIDEIEDRQVLSEKEKINSIDPVKS
jgi:AMMECR1 domain-containing protein